MIDHMYVEIFVPSSEQKLSLQDRFVHQCSRLKMNEKMVCREFIYMILSRNYKEYWIKFNSLF